MKQFWDKVRVAVIAGIRTSAAAIVGLVVAWLASEHGVVLSEEATTSAELAVAGVIGGAYNALVVWLTEHVHKSFGYLLIVPTPPSYEVK